MAVGGSTAKNVDLLLLLLFFFALLCVFPRYSERAIDRSADSRDNEKQKQKKNDIEYKEKKHGTNIMIIGTPVTTAIDPPFSFV